MRRTIRVAAAGLATISLLCGGAATAADHVDSPGVLADLSTDLADLFAWTTPESDKVNLILTVGGLAGIATVPEGGYFSDAAQYVFHVQSAPAFGMAAAATTDVICQFDADIADAPMQVSCWVGDQDYVTGDVEITDGITSASGQTRVFAGWRDDPFYFNGAGVFAVFDAVRGAVDAGGLQFDEYGCPQLDEDTSNALVTLLTTDTMGGPATDLVAGNNVLALVVQVDKTLLNGGGPILGVWASTRQR